MNTTHYLSIGLLTATDIASTLVGILAVCIAVASVVFIIIPTIRDAHELFRKDR